MGLRPNEAVIDSRLTCHAIAATDTSHAEIPEPHYVRMTFTKEQFEVLVQSLQRQIDEQGASLTALDLVARKMRTPNEFGAYGIEITVGVSLGGFPIPHH